jgi:hypothetical protein
MRILLITTCLASIAFAFGTLPWMPETIVTTWGLDGKPSGVMSPITYALVMSIGSVFVGAIILGCSLLIATGAEHYPESINIPNREYWLNEENRPKTVRRICASAEFIGVASMLFMLLCEWEIFKANQLVTPIMDNNNVHIGAAVMLGAVTIEIIRLLWSFRLPKAAEEGKNAEHAE